MRIQKDLRPLWLLVGPEVEELLSSKLGWRTLSCVAEERVSIDTAKKVAKKERQAEDAGVIINEPPLDQPVSQELRDRCDAKIEEWKANRKGSKQVHITEVRPWVDMEHRRYLWAETKEGEVAALCVLHRLSPANGYQIKFALDFPGSPSGTIEALISAAIQALAKAGIRNVTFGAGQGRHPQRHLRRRRPARDGHGREPRRAPRPHPVQDVPHHCAAAQAGAEERVSREVWHDE